MHALWINDLLESIFCLLLVMEAFSLQKVVEMLEEVVASWQEVRWIRWMRQNLVVQFVQLLKHWLCDMQLGVVVEKNWAPSVDQCWLQVLQFSVYLIDLLSILLRCNDLIRIQKVLVDQTGRRPPNSEHNLFLVQVWLWEVRWSFFSVRQRRGHCQLSYKIHFSLHIIIQLWNGSLQLCRIRDDTSNDNFFWFVVSLQGTHLASFSPFQFAFKCQTMVE